MRRRRRPSRARRETNARRHVFDLERTRRSGERARDATSRVGRRIAPPLAAILSLPIVGAAAVIAFASRGGAWIARQIDTLSEIMRPERVLGGVAAASCVLLGLSQFVHYAAVEVDAPGYHGNIARIASAPMAAPRDAGSAHAYVLLGVAALALVLTLLTLRGRWRLGRLVALCGLIGVAVTLAIDLPQGLDAGRAGVAYAGSAARLTEGFYAELSASLALALSGALLAVLEHRAHPAARSRRRGSRRGARRASPRSARLGAARWRWGTGT